MAVDVVGYSRLMGRDEAGTFLALKQHRLDLIEPMVAASGGRVVKWMGDGVLAEFPSVVNAVSCAVAIQNGMGERNAGVVADERIERRIGVNAGDIIIEDGDVFGEGVNIAARLEAMAEPAGITVSAIVREQVGARLDIKFEDLGECLLKNIAVPVRAYCVRLEGPDGTPHSSVPLLLLPERPSLGVMPFVNVGGDEGQDYFTDGMTEDLITGLSRLRSLFVIARNSTFAFKGKEVDVGEFARRLGVRYVLEGSVRRFGERLRVSCRLVDAVTAAHLFAERYDYETADIFAIQDAIVESVVGILEPTLRKAEIERSKRKRPGDLGAYDLYLRAIAHMYEQNSAAREKSVELINQVIERMPDFAEAHGVAAWCYFASSLWEGVLPTDFKEPMLQHARMVQELRSDDASTLAHAAIAIALATRHYETSLDMIERAVSFNPSSAHAHGHGSVINTWAGNYDRSIALSERAIRLSPFDPLGVMPLAGRAGAHLMKSDDEQAIRWARQALGVYPRHTPSFLITIVALVRLGTLEEARTTAERLLMANPTYRIVASAPIFEYFQSELQAAGLRA